MPHAKLFAYLVKKQVAAACQQMAAWLKSCGIETIDGINIMNAQTIIAEVGVDMSRFPSEAHFASFLGLCPDNQITGGKVFRRGTRHVENRAATALRMAATSLWRSKTYLGS
jgi:transposase